VGAPNLQRFARSSANLRPLQSFVNVGYRPGMATRRSAAPTLADVASEAGVSQATASRALADSPLVNANTRRRVWEVAERLRFQPNRLARSLRSGATMAVGLVVPDVGAAFYASALKSAQDVLEAAGYHVLVLNTGRAAEREREALRTLRAHQVDGLLVATSGGYEEIGVPAVFFDNVPARAGAPAVAMDNDAGVRLLVEHLVDVHGHERIAYMGPPETVGTGAGDVLQGAGRERLEAFRAAVGRAGLPLPPEYVRTSEPASFEADGRAAARELMGLERPPTAIVGGTDELATGLLRGLRDGRRSVPGDVALVSFDEPGCADLLDPPLTSLDRHDRELGRIAAEALVRTLRGEGPEPGTVRVPAALSVRRSCGCPLTDDDQ
jgi:LacI family transcriptional regulator